MKINFLYQMQFQLLDKRMLVLFLSFMFFCAAYSQERTITGAITDQKAAPLVGVNVVIKGTTTGTVTDINGKYSIQVPDNNAVLVFSYVGYTNQEIPVGVKTTVDVNLAEEVKEMNEVVVIGYGVQRKSDLTGAVATVTAADVTRVPVTGVDQALQGRAAGVNVIANTNMPGNTVNIEIRGITSINGSQPLFVIDGIPSGDPNALGKLNPGDIQSIEILKDAASAAIYGSSGGNGVVIVTTKRGKAGAMKVSFNYYHGIQNIEHTIKMMNSQQWYQFARSIDPNDQVFTNPANPYYSMMQHPESLPNYDWNNIMFSPAPYDSYDLSMTGGSDKSNYIISGSYLKQGGIVKNTSFDKFTLRINSDHQLTQHVKFEEQANFLNSNTVGFEQWRYTNTFNSPIFNGLRMQPFSPAYDDSGNWTKPINPSDLNPMARIDNEHRSAKATELDATAGVVIDFIKGLTLTSRGTGRYELDDTKQFWPQYYASSIDNFNPDRLDQSMTKNLTWNVQNVLNFQKTIADVHNITVMAGMEASRFWGYDITGTAQNIPGNNIPSYQYFSLSSAPATGKTLMGGATETRTLSYFGRLGYDYKGKYLIQGNIRYDGNSNFGPANKFGTFPSVSLGWKFSEEDFMKNQSILSFGKLRLSYGETGQFARSNWPYTSLVLSPSTFAYSFNNSTDFQGAGPIKIPNPDIHWETVKMTNVGVDLNFFRDRLTFSGDYFKKVNDGMLQNQPVAAVAGSYQPGGTAVEQVSASPEVNLGSVQNTGFEFSLGYKKNEGALTGSIDFNMTFVRNKITKLATDSILGGTVSNDIQNVTILKEGQPISEFVGYQVVGVFKSTDPFIIKNGRKIITNQPFSINPTTHDTAYAQPTARPGDLRFKDINGDGAINAADRTYIGNPNPKFVFGFSLHLNYTAFDFDAVFSGVYGNKIFNGTNYVLSDFTPTSLSNRAASDINSYRDPVLDANGNVIVPGHQSGVRIDANNLQNSNDYMYVQDGSYLRCRSVTLGYTLPKNLTERVRVDRLRVYAGVKNLFTLTKYDGYDPEVKSSLDVGTTPPPLSLGVDISGYPPTRMFVFGATLDF